jgi:hypothetical protein
MKTDRNTQIEIQKERGTSGGENGYQCDSGRDGGGGDGGRCLGRGRCRSRLYLKRQIQVEVGKTDVCLLSHD